MIGDEDLPFCIAPRTTSESVKMTSLWLCTPARIAASSSSTAEAASSPLMCSSLIHLWDKSFVHGYAFARSFTIGISWFCGRVEEQRVDWAAVQRECADALSTKVFVTAPARRDASNAITSVEIGMLMLTAARESSGKSVRSSRFQTSFTWMTWLLFSDTDEKTLCIQAKSDLLIISIQTIVPMTFFHS